MTWTDPFRLIQLNLRLVDAVNLDVSQMIDDLARYGATTIIANAGGIVAWYPTRLAYHRRNPYLRTDFVAEVTEAAHARGMLVLARVDITKGYVEDLSDHPDWFRVGPHGRPAILGDLVETCVSGPYWQAFSFEILHELLSRYPVDGVFFNHHRYLTCYCTRCRDTFASETGWDIPRREDWTDPAWRELVRYRYRKFAEYTARLRAFIEQVQPSAVLCWDYELISDDPAFARDAGWSEDLTRTANVIVSIAFDRLTRPLPKYIYQAGEQAALARSSYPQPVCVLLTYSSLFGNRRVAQPPPQLARDVIQIAARGAAPGISLSGTFAQDDRKALPALADTFAFLRAHKDLYSHLRSAAAVAVVYSPRTADWYGQADPFYRYLAHYRGCVEALVHEHIPFDVVTEGALADALGRYRVVLLPNVACLPDDLATLLDNFVASGGHLVATHETGLYDAEGVPRPSFALQALGRRFVARRVMQGAYLVIQDRKLLGPAFEQTELIGLLWERPYGGFGPLQPQLADDQPGEEGEFIFTDGPDAQTADLFLSCPIRSNVPELAYIPGQSRTPGLTINAFGRGTATYLPWPVTKLYHLYGLIECRWLLARVVELALGGRQLRTDAPASVELVLSQEDSRTVIHLINSTGVENKPLLETIPLGPLTVAVRSEASTARALVLGRALPVVREEAFAIVTVPCVRSFEVVVLE